MASGLEVRLSCPLGEKYQSTRAEKSSAVPHIFTRDTFVVEPCSGLCQVPVTREDRKRADEAALQLQGLYKPRQTMMTAKFGLLASRLSLTPPPAWGKLQKIWPAKHSHASLLVAVGNNCRAEVASLVFQAIRAWQHNLWILRGMEAANEFMTFTTACPM
jgi:hypothetical protein